MNIRKPRGMILLLSFLSLFVALTFQNKIIALVFMAMCLLSAVLILYRHMGDLTDIAGDNPKMKTLKGITIFNGILVIVGVVAAVLIRTEFWNFSANSEKYFAAAVVAVVILFSGNVAPKLPFNRYTGLRLPWTVMDEDTWLVAHRILGYVSIRLYSGRVHHRIF